MIYETVLTGPPQNPARDQARQEIQTTIRNAIQDARRAVEAQGQGPAVAGIPAPQNVIDALKQQLAADKAAVQALTSQLVPGLSESRVDAITEQLGDARERVQTVQGQLDHALGVSTGVVSGMFAPPDFPGPQIPELVLPIVSVVMGTLAFMVVGWPVARAWARRMDRRHAAPTAAPDMSPRFDRVEQGIEAIAIEIERISEGQRYTTKLMSDIRALPAPNPLNDWPGAQGRVGEPVERRGEGKV
ncbi:MAG: hypothetical protein ABI877_12415 [Gemmatimonadaceae bacterium]